MTDENAGGRLDVGAVISAYSPEHLPGGHEQQGLRPAVVVGLPGWAGTPRFDFLIVAPLTTDRGRKWSERSPELYPKLAKGTTKLRSSSICLLDQARPIGAERVRGYRGALSAEEYRPIHEGLDRMMFGTDAAPGR